MRLLTTTLPILALGFLLAAFAASAAAQATKVDPLVENFLRRRCRPT
jgi:hypothetical protein